MLLPCQKPLLVFCMVLSLKAGAQSSLDSLAGRFVRHIRSDKKEKLIILTDKTFYLAGENIWLKAWCLDSLSNRFLTVSKNLYVDLVNDKDSIISQLLFNIPRRRTGGMILLPSSLPEGYYWLRAYTARILREDSGRIFVKPVYVVNTGKPDPGSLSAYGAASPPGGSDSSAPQLLFFPEGGSLIAGTTATVAFSCIGSKGHPLDVSGYVTDTRNDTVAKFATTLPGRGKFSFDAFNPRKYFAHIAWNGRVLTYPLPAIDQYASQLTVVSEDDRTLRMRVSLGDSLYKKNKATRILAISRDSLCFAATGTDMYEVTIPKASFPQGKTTFFLFDDKDRLVSQRCVFLASKDTGLIYAATDKPGYAPGERVNLNIGVKSQNDNPYIEALLSVSVTDDRVSGESAGPQPPAVGLAEVDNALPKHYSAEQTDILMLAQPGLYRDWKYDAENGALAIANGNSDINLLNLRGKVVDKNDEPLESCIVNLFSGDNKFFQIDTTDNNGRFLFPLSDYDDGTQFNMKITDLSGKTREGKVLLDKFNFPGFSTPRRLKQGFGQSDLVLIQNFRSRLLTDTGFNGKEMGMLKPATVKGEIPAAETYDKNKRVSRFSTIITPDAIKNGGVNGIANAIQNVPGFYIGSSASNDGTAPPLVIIDGVPMHLNTDLKTFLQGFELTNIDFIEVLKGSLTAIYGVEGAGGVVLINTISRSRDVAHTDDKGMTTIYPKGYFSQPDVFASGYDKKEAKKLAGSDQPSTLYWNANILTDNRGNAKLNFYTGRQTATYSAAIIGITGSGDILGRRIQIRCQ